MNENNTNIDDGNNELLSNDKKVITTKEKSIGINSFFYLIYTALNMVFPLITGIYVTRVLLPSNIGQVETAFNLVQYFVILSFLGIPTYGLREIAKYRNDKIELNRIYSELRIINNISTAICLLLYILLIFIVPVYRENYFVFLIVGILIFLNFFNNGWLFEGLEEFGYISLRNILFKILSFVLLVIFVKDNDDYYIYAFILTFGTAGNYLLNIFHSRKYVKFTFKDLNIKRHLKSIMFLVFVNLAIEIYMLVDVTMLSFMCDKEVVAYYTYGMKVYRILIQLLNTFTMVLVPRIALYYKENRLKDMNNLLSNTLIILTMFSLPIIVGVLFTSDYLIPLVYGQSYVRSVLVLKIMCFICVISPIGYLLGSRILLITGNESKMVYAVGSGAIANIILNSVLIYFFDEVGAATASLISEIIVMVIYLILGKKYFKIDNIISSIIKILLSLLVMTAFCFAINGFINDVMIKTIIQIAGSIILYFSSLLLMKEKICTVFLKKFLRRIGL